MTSTRLVLAGVCVFLVSGSGFAKPPNPVLRPEVAALLKKRPTKVEGYILAREINIGPIDGESLHGFRVIRKLPVSKRWGTRIARDVLAQQSRSPTSSSLCGFAPGSAFRLWYGHKHVDVLVCSDCEQFWVEPGLFPLDGPTGFDMSRARLADTAAQFYQRYAPPPDEER